MELIDPLNEDTYDDRVIRSAPVRSMLSGPAFDKFYGKKFKYKRKELNQNIRHFHLQIWRIFNA